jgi:hypothetical protein
MSAKSAPIIHLTGLRALSHQLSGISKQPVDLSMADS